MTKRIDCLINKLPIHSNLSLKAKLPLLLRKFIPATAIVCDAQLNEHNQLSWAIIYQDGTDTFIQVVNDNQVYLQGEHEEEIVTAIQALIDQLQMHALQHAWFRQQSLSLADE